MRKESFILAPMTPTSTALKFLPHSNSCSKIQKPRSMIGAIFYSKGTQILRKSICLIVETASLSVPKFFLSDFIYAWDSSSGPVNSALCCAGREIWATIGIEEIEELKMINLSRFHTFNEEAQQFKQHHFLNMDSHHSQLTAIQLLAQTIPSNDADRIRSSIDRTSSGRKATRNLAHSLQYRITTTHSSKSHSDSSNSSFEPSPKPCRKSSCCFQTKFQVAI